MGKLKHKTLAQKSYIWPERKVKETFILALNKQKKRRRRKAINQ